MVDKGRSRYITSRFRSPARGRLVPHEPIVPLTGNPVHQANPVRQQSLMNAPIRSDVTVFDFVHRLVDRVSNQTPSRRSSPSLDVVKASVVSEEVTLQREDRFRRDTPVPRTCVLTVIHP
jgi:hypothetical protein